MFLLRIIIVNIIISNYRHSFLFALDILPHLWKYSPSDQFTGSRSPQYAILANPEPQSIGQQFRYPIQRKGISLRSGAVIFGVLTPLCFFRDMELYWMLNVNHQADRSDRNCIGCRC